jgi:hypothetical protein
LFSGFSFGTLTRLLLGFSFLFGLGARFRLMLRLNALRVRLGGFAPGLVLFTVALVLPLTS